MIKDLRALYQDEVASLVGALSGIADFDDTDESVVNQMIEETVSEIVEATYIKAVDDVKSFADKLIQD